jgi:endonuclease-8
MPEGDSLHRLAARLRPVFAGRSVTSLRARRIPDAAADELVGLEVLAVEAHGKNLLVKFAGGRVVLHVHLRMNGRVFVERPRSAFWAPRRETTPDLRLEVKGASVVGRDLPVCRLLRAREGERVIAELGPDLLGDVYDEEEAVRRLARLGELAIGPALLVQRVTAGIGNVYKSEVLFLEGVDPRAPVSSLETTTLRALLQRARVLLQRNVGPGAGEARTTRTALRGPRLWVYGRKGEPCLRCGTAIEVLRQGPEAGRSTYFCPRCQGRP